jgi:hypothetical protein
LYPDPIVTLTEDENWWKLGLVSIAKTHPTFHAGFGGRILASTHFTAQRFDVNGVVGDAIILVTGGKEPTRFSGWVPFGRRTEADDWVAKLNSAIAKVAPREGDSSSSVTNAVDGIIYDTQNEFASENPVGRQLLELDANGNLKYIRQRNVVLAELVGHVAPTRFKDIVAALKRTAFPSPPQKSFLPGASVVAITALPSKESISISFFEALKLDGYRDVVRALDQLVDALRTNNTAVLAEWQFELQQ